MKDDKKDESGFFVSRRGKQVGVHQVDLNGIDIDDRDTKAAPEKSEKKLITKKSSKRGSGWTRKKTIIVAIVAVVLVSPLIFAEFVVAQYNVGTENAKQDLKSLVDTTVMPAQKKPSISADQIRTVASKLNDTVGKMCRGGLLDNVAGLYPRAKSAHDTCRAEQTKYATFVSDLRLLEADARYLERLDAIIKPAATPITDEYAVVDAQHKTWLSVSEDIKKLSPTDRMRTAHVELAKHVTTVADAWSKLNIANNGQDVAGFEASEKALTAGYEAIRSTSDTFTKVLSASQAKVTADYNVLK